jgi:hypothetical protein
MTDDEQEMLDRISDRMAGSLPGKSLNTVTCLSSPFFKNILFFRRRKSLLYSPLSRPTRGAYRDRHGRGAGCGGRGCALDEWR